MMSVSSLFEGNMGTILQTLKAVATQRPKQISPIALRRSKLIKKIEEQITAAKAKSEGQSATVAKPRRYKNKDTGEVFTVTKGIAVREDWWIVDGKVLFELRYGVKPLEFAKGKTTIEIGEQANLIPTLEKLKEAVALGEFDDQMVDAYSRLAEQLRLKQKKSRK